MAADAIRLGEGHVSGCFMQIVVGFRLETSAVGRI